MSLKHRRNILVPLKVAVNTFVALDANWQGPFDRNNEKMLIIKHAVTFL